MEVDKTRFLGEGGEARAVTRSDINMEDLAQRMSTLDETAFSEFSDIFGPRFRRHFVKRGLNITDAEDLSVSCITDIALKANQYPPANGNFEGWVFTLARHYLVDWWRSRQQLSAHLSDDLPLETPEAETVEPNREVVSAVREAMENLSEGDQQIIRVRDLEGASTFAEIGKELKITAGAARVRHLRALARLEALLDRDSRIEKYLERRHVDRQEK
jgi:RNA polymerase sigma factor (sigma-70 family)